MIPWRFDVSPQSYLGLGTSFYTALLPKPVSSPMLVQYNDALANDLGLSSPDKIKKDQSSPADHSELEAYLAQILSGNLVIEGTIPIAQAYYGHQFGSLNVLGDGRALLLGEHLTPDGKRVDLVLKGSGPTPYSRGGDGRAALEPMLREYLISEAIFHLGIPTTRSLAVCTTGEMIQRETFLPGAVLTRVAASHLRVGTFVMAYHMDPVAGGPTPLQQLADYAIQRHDPDLLGLEGPERYQAFLNRVVDRQASLVAQWQLVGFIHGVLNTDNVAISGETIDYGPCAFMDAYDLKTVFSSIDTYGRYAYGNQPPITSWNLARFAEVMLPLLATPEPDTVSSSPFPKKAVEVANQALARFKEQFNSHYTQGLIKKFGLPESEYDLASRGLTLMATYAMDYTNTFRGLMAILEAYLDQASLDAAFHEPLIQHLSAFDQWTVGMDPDTRMSRIPEVQAFLTDWLSAILAPYKKEAAHNATWVTSLKSVLNTMGQVNPVMIPRNHLVEEALKDAAAYNNILSALRTPFLLEGKVSEYLKPAPLGSSHYKTYCGT